MVIFHFMDPDDAQYDEVPVGAGAGSGTGIGTGSGGRETEIDRVDPPTFDEIFMYTRAKEECEEWIRDYRDGKKVPKILLIQGKKGCGKSFLAEKLIAKYGYTIMDLRARDAPGKKDKDSAMSKKEVMEVFKNSLFFKNVQEFVGEDEETRSQPPVVYLDDIETMLQMGDNVIFNEILNVLKACKRTDLKKEKKDAPNPPKKRGRAKKVEAGAGAGAEEKEYFIYNPIICTCNYTTDKKMMEFRKLCRVVDLGVPSPDDLRRYMAHATRALGFTFPEEYWSDWIEYHEGDLRKIKQSLEELSRMGYSTEERLVTREHISYYYHMFGKVDLTCQLHEGIDMVFQKELSMSDCDIIYSSDPLLVPLMVHYNILDYLQASRGGPSFREKLDSYEVVMRNLCLYDRIHTSNYKTQGWEMPELSAVFSTYVANQEIVKYLPTIGNRFKLRFTNVLNKISQLEVNRAMISKAYNALNRFICDEDELVYLIEISLNYLKIQRGSGDEEAMEGEDGEEGEDEDSPERHAKRVGVPVKKVIAKKLDPHHTLEKSEYREMIRLMNDFNIDLPSLEIILKIEKLNLFQNKNPKRFTARIREELSMFVTATSYAEEES